MYKLIEVANNKRWEHDGIYKHHKKRIYLLTVIHGGITGELTLLWKDKEYKVTPKNIREILYKVSKYRIDSSDKIYLAPCFSFYVINNYKKELDKYHISIIGNYKEIVKLGFAQEKTPYYTEYYYYNFYIRPQSDKTLKMDLD
jgi:hypothetical protein